MIRPLPIGMRSSRIKTRRLALSAKSIILTIAMHTAALLRKPMGTLESVEAVQRGAEDWSF